MLFKISLNISLSSIQGAQGFLLGYVTSSIEVYAYTSPSSTTPCTGQASLAFFNKRLCAPNTSFLPGPYFFRQPPHIVSTYVYRPADQKGALHSTFLSTAIIRETSLLMIGERDYPAEFDLIFPTLFCCEHIVPVFFSISVRAIAAHAKQLKELDRKRVCLPAAAMIRADIGPIPTSFQSTVIISLIWSDLPCHCRTF